MKYLVLLLLLIIPSKATITSVCSTAGSPTGNPATTPAIDSTGAWMLTISDTNFTFNPATATRVDSKGNTFHLAASTNVNNASLGLAYAWDHGGTPLSVGAGHTATITGNYPGAVFCAWLGATAALADVWDSSQHNTGSNASGTNVTIGAITPVANTHGTLIIASMGKDNTDGTITASNGFTVVSTQSYAAGNNMYNSLAFKVQGTPASTGLVYDSGGTNGAVSGVIASFQITSGTPPVSSAKASVTIW